MALTKTLKASGEFGLTTTVGGALVSTTLGAITFAAGSLVVVVLHGTKVEATASTMVATASGLTFTEQAHASQLVANKADTAIFTAPDASGGSRSIAITSGTKKCFGLFYAIYEVTGYDGTTPIGAVIAQADNLTDGAKSMTLPSAPLADSVVLAAVGVDTDPGLSTIDPGSTFTEDAEVDSSASFYGVMEVESRTGSTSTTVDWADVKAGASVTAYSTAGVAIEIRAARFTITNLYQVGSSAITNAGTGKTSSAFTPPASSKLTIAAFGESSSGVATFTLTDSVGLSWTQVEHAQQAAGFFPRITVWEADIGASPVSMTVTVTPTVWNSEIAYAVYAVTGGHRKTGQDIGAASTAGATYQSGTLPSAATNGNLSVFILGVNTDAFITPPTPSGWTNLAKIAAGGGTYEKVGVSYKTDFTGTSASAASTGENLGWGVVLLEYEQGPEVVSFTPTATWDNNTTSQTTPGFNAQAGDLLVLMAARGNGSNPYAAGASSISNSGAALTWTERERFPTSSDSSVTSLAIWTAVVDTNRTGMTVTVGVGGAEQAGHGVYVIRNHGGVGNSEEAHLSQPTTGAPSRAITAAGPSSRLIVINDDWNANSAARTYRQVDGANPTERATGGTNGVSHWVTVFDYLTTSAGSKTVGMTAPAAQTYTIEVIEILPASSGPKIGLIVNSLTLSTQDQTISNLLTGAGYAVTAILSTSALTDGVYNAYVITESGAATSAAITSIPTSTTPVLLMETSVNTMRLATAGAIASSEISTQQYDILANSHAIVTDSGVSDPVTIYPTNQSMYSVDTSQVASGAVKIARVVSTGTNDITMIAAEIGSTLTTGTAPARRVWYGAGVGGTSVSNWQAGANALFLSAVEWLTLPPVYAGEFGYGYWLLEDGSGRWELEANTDDWLLDTTESAPIVVIARVRGPIISNVALNRSHTR